MISRYIYITDDLMFLCTALLLLYLFILAIASHLKRISYPESTQKYRCAILVPENSPLPARYREEPYEFITYRDLYQAVNGVDREHYSLVLLLSGTAASLSPRLLDKINDVYDAGIQAVQLHTVIENRQGIQNRLRTICEEIKNSLFRAGNTQIGLSSQLAGTNMAIDLKWLQDNLKSSRTNIERKLFRKNIYIGYLPDAIVYCRSFPLPSYRKRTGKTVSYLLPSFLGRDWSFCNRIVQELIPSPLKICSFIVLWTLSITIYDWTLSFGWWLMLLGLLITYSLAIPDYLVKEKGKKHSIWRKRHSSNKSKEMPA